MKKLSVAAGLALAFAAGSAIAADLPSMKGPPPAYVPPPPMVTWNGLYGGVNIGYGFGAGGGEQGTFFMPSPVALATSAWNAPVDLNGIVGGGQIGYNWQFSPWLVLGVEADIQAADLNTQTTTLSSGAFPAGLAPFWVATNSAKSVDWFGTARGRIGFVLPSWPNLMLYGTGGFAYGQVVHAVSVTRNLTNFFSNGRSVVDTTATGWTAGGGVEWMPMAFPSWSLKVEYLYTDLGNTNQGQVGTNLFPGAAFIFNSAVTSPTRFHTVRAGLNWHFNPFGGAPVMAKY